jgi:lysophospholipase L1-like esterase
MKHALSLRFLMPVALAAGLTCACAEGDKSFEETLAGNGGEQPSASAGSGGTTEPGAGGSAAGGSGGTTGAGGSGSPVALNPFPVGSTVKILAVGDSITRATCWRAKLWESLNGKYQGRFDFVGTLQSNPGCTPANFDQDNQGYSSSLVTEVVAGITTARMCDPMPCPTLADLSAAFTTAQPDVVLMHFGTNDVWNNRPATTILDAYSQVLDAARSANANVIVMVAQIIPMNVTATTCAGCTCPTCPTGIMQLDTQIVDWAASKSTTASPVVVVDQLTGFDATADNRDGVHPNDQGSQKMAARWFDALEPLFGD